MLVEHPEMQRKARDEVDQVLKGSIPDAESVKSLTYLDMFIRESMYASAPGHG